MFQQCCVRGGLLAPPRPPVGTRYAPLYLGPFGGGYFYLSCLILFSFILPFLTFLFLFSLVTVLFMSAATWPPPVLLAAVHGGLGGAKLPVNIRE